MKNNYGLCPKCGSQTVMYDRVRNADRLYCINTTPCDFYTVQSDAGFNSVMAQVFPPDTTTFYAEDKPTLTEQADRRLAQTFLLAGQRRCGTRPVAVAASPDDERR